MEPGALEESQELTERQWSYDCPETAPGLPVLAEILPICDANFWLVWNVLGARTLSASGRQLFTIDKFRDTGRPLLEILADPESIFIKGLAKFQRRTLYANIVNDRSAVYYTTGISKHDPFTNLDKIKINYVKDYEDVIVDSSNPIAPNNTENSTLTLYGQFLESSQTTVGRLPFLLAMVFFIPFGVVAFLVNSLVQSLRSNRRIRLHESGLAGIQPGNYRVPLLITGVREAVEDVYENLNSAQSNEYLAAGTEEEVAQEEPSYPMSERSYRSEAPEYIIKTTPGTDYDPESSAIPLVEKSQSNHNPTLALASYQFRMIQALDYIGWRKYPVYIHKVRHSHAAIIVVSLTFNFFV
jgi:hypothetical protein